MKNIILYLLVSLSFFTFAYADNNSINGDCPGEPIEEIDGENTTVTYTEIGGIGNGGNDRYRMTLPVAGTLSIEITNRDASRNANYDFYLSNTSCGNWNLVKGVRGRSHTANVTINPGDTVWVRMQSIASEPNKGRHDYALTITFTPTASLTSNNPRPFTKVNVAGQPGTNINGDLLVIGNQSLCYKEGGSSCVNPPFDASNNDYFQEHANLDSEASSNGYLNSTSANLTLNPEDKVVEAWLYWIGRLDTNNQTTRASAATIQLKTPTSGGYVSLTATDKFNWMVDGSLFDYGGAIDITQHVQQGGTYWVADLKATEQENQGSGWAIAVVVKDTAVNKTRTLKNISLYDGFNGVYNSGSYPATVSSEIKGFFTPRSGTIKSNLIVFAGETDRSLNDSMSLTRKNGTEVDIKDSQNDTNNVQNGTISKNGINVTSRSPKFENTLGIDIDEIDVSHIIQYEQTSTMIKVDSKNDRIFLSMYGFATDLYLPKLCYDYNVRKDGVSLNVTDRDINTVNTGNLAVNVSIRSMEGDFDLEFSNLKLRLTPSNKVSFIDAYYSPSTVNIQIPAVYSTSSTAQNPEIGIGSGISGSPTTGGTIGARERYFSKFNYHITDAPFAGHFEVDLNTSIDFGSGPAPLLLSSENGTLPRCEQSQIYRPQWGQFNIERTNSGAVSPITAANERLRFPLYTQVVGRDFDFSMVSYDKDAGYRVEQAVSDVTIDVELIDASPYDDNNSFFKCSNTDQDIIQTFPGGARNFFVRFPSKATSRVDLTGPTNINVSTDTALRNAAFRMWRLVDSNGTFIDHTCTLEDNSCFETLYAEPLLQAADTQNICQSACTTGTNPAGTSGCYSCLKNNFATAVCSRDNFSIRPASYRINILDNNESNDSSKPEISLGINNTTTTVATLAAGYSYKIDVNATQIGTDDFAKRYYGDFVVPSSADFISQLQFNTISGSACADRNNTDWGIRFENGQIQGTFNSAGIALESNNLQSHPNVGIYDYHIEDQNWTIVDQQRYVSADGTPLKTFPGVDDCLPNDSTISANGNFRTGCGISSQLPVGSPGRTYEDMRLQFEPYKFGLDQVTLAMDPNNGANYLFMNDFDSAFYADTTLNTPGMSGLFSGQVRALSKNDTITTNFTNLCASRDVVLSVGRTTSPDENVLLDSKGNLVEFQLALQDSNSTIDPIFSTAKGEDANITLPRASFLDILEGASNMRLHTTFQKPLNATINPIDINYTNLIGFAPTASSSAGMGTHVPDGNNTYGRSIVYYFGKVTPYKTVYPNVIARGLGNFSVQTPISVDIFCDYTDGRCADNYNLTLPSKGQNVAIGWLAATMFDQANDGTTDLSIATSSAAGNVTPNNNVRFNDGNGTRNDVTTSATAVGTVIVDICPDPWLRYDISDARGCPDYKVNFIGNSGWSGVGNVGRASGEDANRNPGPSRTSW